jgi:hypothetical protein
VPLTQTFDRDDDMTSTPSYEPFERLISSLRGDGHPEEAQLIHDMIHKVAWTTGSELIGELGRAIARIRKQKLAGLSDESRRNMVEAMAMVRRVWPRLPEQENPF